jgi:hypothetical protein
MPSRYLVAPIPTGQLGLNGSQNEANIPLGALTVANSISFSEGGFVKEGGSAKYNATAVAGGSDSVIGGIDYHPVPDTQRQFIATQNGYILRATGTATTGTFSNVATDVSTVADSVIFVEGGAESTGNDKKLFIFNGKNSVRLVSGDGTALATMANPPADWADTATGAPRFGLIHDGRLWGGGNRNSPFRMYYSTATDHTEFTTTGAGTFPIYPGEGDTLMAAVSFKELLFCFKYPRGIYYIDSTDPAIANWTVRKISDNIGIAGPQAYAVVENDVIFLDSSGQFQLLSSIDKDSKNAANISKDAYMGQWFRDNVNLSRLKYAKMIYYSQRREVHCALPGLSSTYNNLRVVIDFNNPGVIRFRSSDKDAPESIWLFNDADNIERPMIGDEAGFVWLLDREAKSKDGSGYSGSARIPSTDFSELDQSLAVVRKNFQWLEMVVNPTGNFDVNASIYIDGELTETVTFNMGTDGAQLGSFELDTDVLGGGSVLNRKRQIHGSGRRFAVEVENNGAAEDFNISRMYVHFTPGNSMI